MHPTTRILVNSDTHRIHPSINSCCRFSGPMQRYTGKEWHLYDKSINARKILKGGKNLKNIAVSMLETSCVHILLTDNYFANPQGILECNKLHNKIQHSTGIKKEWIQNSPVCSATTSVWTLIRLVPLFEFAPVKITLPR